MNMPPLPHANTTMHCTAMPKARGPRALEVAVFYPLFLSYHQRSKPVCQDIQLQRCSFRSPGESSSIPILRHVFSSCNQVEPLNSPLKSKCFLSEVGQQYFERLTLPILFIL
jgi:hypothetical protein